MMRTFVSSLLMCSMLAAAAPALAAGVDPANATPVQREQAQSHFLKGKERFDHNDMPAALEEFRASLEIVASPNARLYVARTLREMGRLVEAYAEFGRTAAEAKEHEREDGRYGKAAEAALAERAAIAPQISFVQLNIKNSTDATTVTVAGSPLVRAGWSDPVPVKPGDVEVEVVTPGVLPIRKTLTLKAGDKAPLDIDAGAPQGGGVASAGGSTAPGAETGHGSRAGKSWMLPAAIAGGGVFVAGMLTFTIAGIASNNTYNDLKSKCGGGPCPSNLSGEVSSGKTQQAVANTGLVVGLIGLAVGGTFFALWLVPPKNNAPAAASARLLVGPGSLGFAGTF
jgi:hypothetical protein